MGLFRLLRYKYLLKNRKRRYASLAVSLALAHASFGQVKYKSLGNGMADITLALEDDQKFKLDFRPLDERKNYVMKGKWTIEEGNYILKFRRTRQDLKSLFTSNTGFYKTSEIADRKTVKIPSSTGGIMIWGIYCVRDSI